MGWLNASDYPFAKGDYFVKIRAEDEQSIVRWSKPFKVSIARTYRATKTASKAATAYHHVGPDSPLDRGGQLSRLYLRGVLRILCQTAKVIRLLAMGLADNERIEKASFVIDNPTSGCPRSIRSFGHTKHGSSITVKEDVVGDLGIVPRRRGRRSPTATRSLPEPIFRRVPDRTRHL